MFTAMKNFGVVSAVSLLGMTSIAYAEVPRISDISVETSYSAAQDTNAAQAFPQITEDLRTAIAARVPMSDDGGDPRISVDIRRISLNGNTMIPETGEFNEIQGVVSISSQDRSIGDVSFQVNVAALPADVSAPEGFILIPPSTGEYYSVMINGFADRVAVELEGVNTSGDGVTR